VRVAHIVVVSIVVAGLLGAVPSASADQILFARIPSDRLWVVHPDGSGLRPLPYFGLYVPDLSADGRRLLWVDQGHNDLRTASITGGRRRVGRVVWRPRGGPTWGRWSPSGRQIVATRDVKPPDDWACCFSQVFVVRPGRGRARKLRTPGVSMATPSWSPDGRRIVAGGTRLERTCPAVPTPVSVCTETYFQALWVIDVASGAAREILQIDGEFGPAAWSPDGRTIAFSQQAGNPPEQQLWLVGPDGTGLRQITQLPGGAGWPSWSSDGRRLAFETAGKRRNIATIRPDGSGLRILTHRGTNLKPDWSR
jgi:Tol biopolymer transport system component